MRLKKNLSQLVESNFTPLSTDKEGLLRGGFGALKIDAINAAKLEANGFCRNPKCTNGECDNPNCSNNCTINYCPPSSKASKSAAFFQGF